MGAPSQAELFESSLCVVCLSDLTWFLHNENHLLHFSATLLVNAGKHLHCALLHQVSEWAWRCRTRKGEAVRAWKNWGWGRGWKPEMVRPHLEAEPAASGHQLSLSAGLIEPFPGPLAQVRLGRRASARGSLQRGSRVVSHIPHAVISSHIRYHIAAADIPLSLSACACTDYLWHQRTQRKFPLW